MIRGSANYAARGLSIILLAFALACSASPSDTGLLVYRTSDGSELTAEIFAPQGTMHGADRAAIVLFHGGAWHRGEPRLTHPMCRYFAGRGMVAVAAQYRLADEAAITPIESMEDAREIISWMRDNASRLGIDASRIAAGGWSSGGHLAAMAAITEGADTGSDYQPNALVLWFPSVAAHVDPDFQRLLQDRTDPASISPVKLVRSGLPPTVILQGSRDRVSTLAAARRFCDQMAAAGNRCDLHVYKDRGHVFTHDIDDYVDTMVEADAFLVSLGFLEGDADAEAARRYKRGL